MELLLINHPLDCPICDKGGECPLQNQAMSSGRAESRFVEEKRTFAKPLPISDEVLLDRERCVLCQRCTRFSRADRGRPVHRAARARRAPADRHRGDRLRRGRGLPVLLLRQHHPDLPGRRADLGVLPASARRPFDLVSTPGVRALRLGRGDPPRLAPRRRSPACSPARSRRSTRSGSRQGPLRVPLPAPRRSGCCADGAWRRRRARPGRRGSRPSSAPRRLLLAARDGRGRALVDEDGGAR